jgi:hypothetical protein
VETVHDRLTVEIRRGCTRGCRFCQPGMLTRPARDVEPEEVIEAVQEGMRRTGYADFSLLSLSCSDYLALPAVGVELRNRLADQNVSLTLPSQRVDRFDENIAHILGGTRKAGLTFAPEAGTQRLRDIVNKGLTDAELLRGIRTAMEQVPDHRQVLAPSSHHTSSESLHIAKLDPCRLVAAQNDVNHLRSTIHRDQVQRRVSIYIHGHGRVVGLADRDLKDLRSVQSDSPASRGEVHEVGLL